ncbi:hypothetical protein ABPG77_010905 [Micractinium sp. CCAP 211/92]
MQALSVRPSVMRSSLALQRRPSFRANCVAPRRALPVVRASADREQKAEEEQATAAATTLLAAAGLLAPFLLDTESAMAVPEILKGRTASLIHPGIMFFLFGGSVWAGWLGLQWRRTRELATIIKEKKAQLPKPDADGNRPSSPLDAEISALEAERKELIGKKLNEQHNNWGSLLLGLGVTISIAGAYNTFLRTGKLFPGPHLYAGALITVLWALAAALVPAMQKGNDTARSLHIGLNTINVLLFASQIPTGLEIVGKVLQFTSWP